MKNSEIPFFLGYVEQGLGGNQDPLYPPISISKNGTLAKWRDKLNFFDLRVNDPGLKRSAALFEQQLQKAETLGIKAVITLPEFLPILFDVPPDPPAPVDPDPRKDTRRQAKKPSKLVYFKPAYLSLPSALIGNSSYHCLTVEECLPVIELAAKYKVEHVIVPVSEPGIFLDPQAETKFKQAFKALHQAAAVHEIKLHVRNGGISSSVFKKLAREFNCGLAYDIGTAHLEGDDLLQTYENFSESISILMLHQVLPGIDKLGQRREGMERALKDYVLAKKEYRQSLEDTDANYTENCLKKFNYAYKDYIEASRNNFFNLGLFQSGDINIVPLLKELRRDIEAGQLKYLLLAMVPNTKNNDLVIRNVVPDNFSGTI